MNNVLKDHWQAHKRLAEEWENQEERRATPAWWYRLPWNCGEGPGDKAQEAA